MCSTVVFPPLGNSDHVVSVSMGFPSNSKGDVSFHCLAYDYCCADWVGLCDHLKDVTLENLALNLVLLLLLLNFLSESRFALMYIFLHRKY